MSAEIIFVSEKSNKREVEYTDSFKNWRIWSKDGNKLVVVYYYKTGIPRYEENIKKFDEVLNDIKKVYPNLKNVTIVKINSNYKAKFERVTNPNNYPEIRMCMKGQILWSPKYDFRNVQNPIWTFNDIKELESFNRTNDLFIGYFDNKSMPEYDIFCRLARNLVDYCQFAVRFGYFFDHETSNYKRPPNQPTIIFQPATAIKTTRPPDKRETYKGCVKKYDDLNLWAHKKCLVRELTFENYDDFASCQLYILFYNPRNTAIIKDFRNMIGEKFIKKKSEQIYVTADGLQFFGYLCQFGLKKKDLPIIKEHGSFFINTQNVYSNIGKFKAFMETRYYGKRRSVSIEEYVKSNIKK
ncbi:hypothetical protein PV327_007870 [Microctonus hyperodae]|uniref:Uncharacterized protein n=1 Tax=Microctonus hyperodae TaxID=165561 RepID=A0AA39G1F5_MICHY|nr:hypothetical protein PV327_007870 [Microctonus hyperodae]